jgi:hypothetical protein
MIEEARHSVPPMAASETFFDGKIAVNLTLGGYAGASGVPGPGSEGGGRRGGGGGRHGGGAGGMNAGVGGIGGGRGAMGGDSGGGYSHGSAEGMSASPSGGEPETPVRRAASEMPPTLMRLRLENTTVAAVVVEVHEVNSELGNFAVRPDKLTVAPGEWAEPDPMQSLLGLDTYALPVTITLRVAGQTETKILTLHPVASAPAAPAPTAVPPPAN